MNGKKQKTRLLARASLQEVSASEAKSIDLPDKATAGTQLEDQRDLLKMSSILVSTGMNLNDDVFLSEEVLPARDTGAHKPVNIEHDSTQIIGHMLRTYVTDKDGSRVDEEAINAGESIPEEFDITNEAVIYSFQLPEIAEEIKQRALAGDLFVSVEAWFTDFDYLVGNKVVARNSDTAPILDPILRSNGGKGNFEGQKVGRVLRNILFGGIGVVAQPANPESIIRSVGSGSNVEISECDVESIDEVLAQHVVGSLKCSTSSLEEEVDMSKGENNTREEVLEEVAAILKSHEEANDSAKAADNTDDNSPVSDENDSNNELDQLRDENKSLSDRISHFELKERRNERSQVLIEAGLNKDQVQARITKVIAMSDEDFEAYLEDVKELVSAKKQLTKDGGDDKNISESKSKSQKDKDKDMDDEDEEDEDKSESSVEEDDDDVSLDLGDIDPVDNDLPVRSNSSAKTNLGRSLTDEMADEIFPVFASRNPKLFGSLTAKEDN